LSLQRQYRHTLNTQKFSFEAKQVSVRYSEHLVEVIAALRELRSEVSETSENKLPTLTDVTVLRHGIRVALSIEQGRTHSQQFNQYDGVNQVMGDALDEGFLPTEKAKLERCPKVFTLDPESMCELNELRGMPRFQGATQSTICRYSMLLYAKLFTARCAGNAFVTVDPVTNLITSELRVPGFPPSTDIKFRELWQFRINTVEGQSCIGRYIERPGNDHSLWGGMDGEDRLFVAQSIVAVWFGEGRDVLEFINGPAFSKLLDSIYWAHHHAFDDAEYVMGLEEVRAEINEKFDVTAPDRAKDMLNEFDVLGVSRRQIKQSFVGLTAYFWAYTKAYLKRAEALNEPITMKSFNEWWFGELELNDRFMPVTQIDKATKEDQEEVDENREHSPFELSDLADLIRLWKYESLDCRVHFWIERAARKHYMKAGGKITPLVDMTFRLLSRSASNMATRAQSFERLIEIDIDDQHNNRYDQDTVRDVHSLAQVIEGMNASNQFGWQAHRPWTSGRDQVVRDRLICEKLRDRVSGRSLTFGYCAFDYQDGVESKCWLADGSDRIDQLEGVRKCVTTMAMMRQGESEESRYKLSGRGISIRLDDGYLVVAHTHRRLFALSIQGDDLTVAQERLQSILGVAGVEVEAVTVPNTSDITPAKAAVS